jgi:hypothetical protein
VLHVSDRRDGEAVMIAGRRQRWHELAPRERGAIVLLGAVQAALLAAALRDAIRRPAGELTAPKPVWVAACFVNFLGPIAYFVFGRRRPTTGRP